MPLFSNYDDVIPQCFSIVLLLLILSNKISIQLFFLLLLIAVSPAVLLLSEFAD